MTNTTPTLIDISNPEEDELRTKLLGFAHQATCVAVKNTNVIAMHKFGKLVFHVSSIGSDTWATKLVYVTWQRVGKSNAYRFWMNASSMKHIGNYFRTLPRVNFNVATTMTSDWRAHG